MDSKRALWVSILPLLLVGCGGIQSVVPQQSTLAQVRDRMGRPTDIRIGADGNELWEYATGPTGEHTYLVRAAKDGRVIDVTQLLTPEQFAKIARNVTTKAQVRELLGRPSEQQYFGDEAVCRGACASARSGATTRCVSIAKALRSRRSR
jgi:hypothetical protein